MKFNFKFVQNKKIFFIFTAVCVIIGLASMIFRGFYWDVDFAGGTEITYTVDNEGFVAADELDTFEEIARGVVGDKINVVQLAGANEIIIKSLELDETERDAIRTGLETHYREAYGLPALEVEEPETEATETETTETEATETEATETEVAETEATETEATETEATETETTETEATETEATETEATETEATETEATETEATETETAETEKVETIVKIVGFDSVSGSVSKDLRDSAILSAVVAVILMLAYITIRFQFSSALAAVVCLCHDVFMILAAYSILQIPMSSSVIAVILTILGYSINATIIIFDRVRENVRLVKNATFAEKVNISINQTLMRSINTTITTLLTIGLIYLMGVQTIKEFSFPLIVGIVAGLYSSVCLSGSLWTIFKRKNERIK